MQKRVIRSRGIALAAVIITAVCAVDASAQQVECQGPVKDIAAVTKPAGHVINTAFQGVNLQPLLATTIQVETEGCLTASLSGQVRITDNFVVFQVRVDGVPLQGHAPMPGTSTPVVFVAIDASTANQDEQIIDPTKAVSFNFFGRLQRGAHLVEVLGAAASTIHPDNPPTATHLVLTLAHR